jgi:KaiC/GvpD/RAD55 family RecA-like ATPase
MVKKSKTIRTHIPVLDKMLGYNENYPDLGVIEDGSIVIIRGEPGCGKTTLGLQILSHFLQKNPVAWGGYFSLEKDPNKVLEKMSRDFKMFPQIKNRVALIPSQNIQDLLQFISMKKENHRSGGIFDTEVEKYVRILSEGIIAEGKITDTFRKAAAEAFVDLVKYWKGRLGGEADKARYVQFTKGLRKLNRTRNPTNTINMVFLDSVNAFIRILSVSLPSSDSRILVKIFFDALQIAFGQVVIIASSEATRGTDFGMDSMSESYLCDIEILLRTEPVAVAKNYMGEDGSPVGYSIIKVREDLEVGRNQVETRPFCRVVKSRDCAHESRRCSYEITHDEGIRFFETYPGDGRLVMFSENDSQQKCWEDFAARDLPSCYPGLRYEIFHRQNLQTVYEGQRRLRNIPVKTDLYMSSIDNYWVHWYCEFKLKEQVTRIIGDACGENPAITEIDRAKLINSVVHFARHHALEQLETNNQPKNEEIAIASLCGSQSLKEEILSQVKNLLKSKKWTYLIPIAPKNLRLYGEKNAGFLEAIEKITLQIAPDKSSVGEQIDPEKKKNKSFLAIPYDANVSFIVSRKDLLTRLHSAMRRLNSDLVEKPDEPVKNEGTELAASVRKCFSNWRKIPTQKLPGNELHEEVLKRIVGCNIDRELSLNKTINSDKVKKAIDEMNSASHAQYLGIKEAYIAKLASKAGFPTSANNRAILSKCAERIVTGKMPETFDELMVVYELTGYKFLIETLTFDTLLCFWWELVWNCGGDIVVHGDYSIDKDPDKIIPALNAIYYLYVFFQKGIIPFNSSVEAENHSVGGGDWIFARHWYSTLVDLLTKQKPRDQQMRSGKDKWIWTPPKGTELGIQNFPVSLDRFFGSKDGVPKDNVPGVASIGQWSFAIIDGSENEALGIDLINNLMGSQKITERASVCAAVPTINEFYRDYGNYPCVNIPDRKDIKQPRMTYNKLKDMIETAKPRTDKYDYRHCAKIFHALIREIIAKAVTPEGDNPAKKLEIDMITLTARFFNCIKQIEGYFSSSTVHTAPDERG